MHELILKPGKEKSFINRHPWVFTGAVAHIPQAPTGSVVMVKSSAGHKLGVGFLDKQSQIVCRIFEFEPDNYYESENYWFNKLDKAMALRSMLLHFDDTNCYRLCHAEGDFMPGVIIDVYAKCAVLELLISGTLALESVFTTWLLKNGFESVYVKKNLDSGRKLQEWKGLPMPYMQVQEWGLHYDVDIENGQKTGFFLDQRDNRALVQQYARGKKVLNAFCYNGGFSLHALKAGALHVDSVDISPKAIELTAINVAANFNHASTAHNGLVMDCFEYLRQMPNDYELIILDPPAFAKKQSDVNKAARGYKDINLQAIKKIKPGGIIFTFSCSQHVDRELFSKIIFSAAVDAKRKVRILHHLSQPPDHPINIFHPEGAYLKGLVLHVE